MKLGRGTNASAVPDLTAKVHRHKSDGRTGRDDPRQVMLALLFGAISLLYATVGQAGGTAFLALMAFASFPSNEMRPTALLLNIVATTYSTWLFNRGLKQTRLAVGNYANCQDRDDHHGRRNGGALFVVFEERRP